MNMSETIEEMILSGDAVSHCFWQIGGAKHTAGTLITAKKFQANGADSEPYQHRWHPKTPIQC